MLNRVVSLMIVMLIGLMGVQTGPVLAANLGLTNDPHTGAGMLMLTADGTPWNSTSWSRAVSGLVNGSQYTISMCVKGDIGVSTSCRLVNSSSWSADLQFNITVNSNMWYKVTSSAYTYDSAKTPATLLAFLESSNKAGVIYVDDVTFTCVSGSGTPTISDNSFETLFTAGNYANPAILDLPLSFTKNDTQIHKLEEGDIDITLPFTNAAGLYPDAVLLVGLYKGKELVKAAIDVEMGMAKNASVNLSVKLKVSEVTSDSRINVFLWERLSYIRPLSMGTTKVYDTDIVHELNLVHREIDNDKTYRRGVNIMGAEFGWCWRLNGSKVPYGTEGAVFSYKNDTDYTFNNEAVYKYFAGKGFDTFRVPIKWEGIQPVLDGPLDAAYLKGLKNNVAWAKKYGGQIIIDIHNYAAYDSNIRDNVGSMKIGSAGGPTAEQFADLWVRLSNEFKDETGVYAYDLMNEPVGISVDVWKPASQDCVTAIRNNGDDKLIMVEGVYYSNAAGWVEKNSVQDGGWITDPSDNYMYSAHCYFDKDNSGTYQNSPTSATEGGQAVIISRMRKNIHDFIDWCKKYGYRGYIGEFGNPTNAEWLAALDEFLYELDEAGMDASYWQGGTWSTNDGLSCLASSYKSFDPAIHGTTYNASFDRPQMEVLLRHLSKK